MTEFEGKILDLLKRAEISLGAFCHDEEWDMIDMDTLDAVSAAIALIKYNRAREIGRDLERDEL